MPIRLVAAHPHVFELTGRTAVFRGPILYCAESADNPTCDPRDVSLDPSAAIKALHDPDLLGGVTVLQTTRPPSPRQTNPGPIRCTAGSPTTTMTPKSAQMPLTLIPYHVWANREPGPMEVWLRTDFVIEDRISGNHFFRHPE